MRIVIEFSDGVETQTTELQAGPTITVSPDGGRNRSVPAPVEGSGDGSAYDAGAAPTTDPTMREPAAFSDGYDDGPGLRHVDDVASRTHDAGPAPGMGVHTALNADDLTGAADADAINAGSAPGGFDGEDPAYEDSVIGNLSGVSAIDAGSAPSDLVDDTVGETAMAPDDLTVISGLGPKSAATLIDAGISTYAALAAVGEDELRQILAAAGIAVSIDSWVAQAESMG